MNSLAHKVVQSVNNLSGPFKPRFSSIGDSQLLNCELNNDHRYYIKKTFRYITLQNQVFALVNYSVKIKTSKCKNNKNLGY